MLFDIAPDEPSRDKKAKRRPAVVEKAVAVAPAVPAVSHAAQRPLGVIDEVFECVDSRCCASIHDIVEDIDGRWLIECMFCGTGQWVRAIKGHLKPQFVFPSGDYAGRRIDEVSTTPRGLAYVEWAASEHKSEPVRAACQKHLDSLAPAE
jgi:hypothetical protein